VEFALLFAGLIVVLFLVLERLKEPGQPESSSGMVVSPLLAGASFAFLYYFADQMDGFNLAGRRGEFLGQSLRGVTALLVVQTGQPWRV
jgi:hypothetical protein